MGSFGRGLADSFSSGVNAFLDERAQQHQRMLEDEQYQLERMRVLQAIEESKQNSVFAQQRADQANTVFNQGQEEYRQMHTVDPRYQYNPMSDVGPMPPQPVSPYDYERLTGYSNPIQYNMEMDKYGQQSAYANERLDQMRNPRMDVLDIPGYGEQEIPFEDKASVINSLIQLEGLQRSIDNGRFDKTLRGNSNPLTTTSVIQDRIKDDVRQTVMNIAKPILVSTGNYNVAANSSSNPEASLALEGLIQNVANEVFADADTLGYIRIPSNLGQRVNALFGIASSNPAAGGGSGDRVTTLINALKSMNADSTGVK